VCINSCQACISLLLKVWSHRTWLHLCALAVVMRAWAYFIAFLSKGVGEVHWGGSEGAEICLRGFFVQAASKQDKQDNLLSFVDFTSSCDMSHSLQFGMSGAGHWLEACLPGTQGTGKNGGNAGHKKDGSAHCERQSWSENRNTPQAGASRYI